MKPACFYGIGVGPGDPELLTFKAHRLIHRADVVAYIVNGDGDSRARAIASSNLPAAGRQRELPIRIEMCRDRQQAKSSYDEAAAAIERELTASRQVAFLCEGDPLLYGSFAYLLDRIGPYHSCGVVPGIASPQAAAAASLLPLALWRENLAVISARCAAKALQDALVRFDNLAILKVGRERARVLRLIAEAGRTRDTLYLENIGQPEQRLVNDVETLSPDCGPYFSLLLVSRRRGRP